MSSEVREWSVVQCPEMECSKFMLTRFGTKRKKCPYCGRSFKVSDNYIKSTRTQEEARTAVQILNHKL